MYCACDECSAAGAARRAARQAARRERDEARKKWKETIQGQGWLLHAEAAARRVEANAKAKVERDAAEGRSYTESRARSNTENPHKHPAANL